MHDRLKESGSRALLAAVLLTAGSTLALTKEVSAEPSTPISQVSEPQSPLSLKNATPIIGLGILELAISCSPLIGLGIYAFRQRGRRRRY